MMAQCPVCKRDTAFYKDVSYGDKCLFHCDKQEEHWADPASSHTRRFWRAIRDQVRHDRQSNQNHDFTGYIFPAFEEFFPTTTKTDTPDGVNFFIAIEGKIPLTFSQRASFENATFSQGAKFERATFSQGASFQNATFSQHSSFENTKFSQDASFYWATFLQSTSFYNATFSQGASFQNATFSQHTSFYEATFSQQGSFKYATFSQGAEFRLKKSSSDKQTLTGLTVTKELTISGGDALSTLILGDLTIEDKASLILKDLTCDHLTITNLTNKGSNSKFTNVTITDALTVASAMFDKTEFNGLDVSRATKIFLTHTSFLGSHLTNIQWGAINPDRFAIDRQMARQLKAISDTQGETINANSFYTLEMALHAQDLKKEGAWQERVVHTIHDMVSHHSSDWLLALLWFLGVGFGSVSLSLDIIPYTLIVILLLLPIPHFFKHDNPQKMAICYFVIFLFLYILTIEAVPLPHFGLDYLFSMVNPLAIKAFDENLKSIPSVILYPTRLIEIFIGYQFITALRKNTRRK